MLWDNVCKQTVSIVVFPWIFKRSISPSFWRCDFDRAPIPPCHTTCPSALMEMTLFSYFRTPLKPELKLPRLHSLLVFHMWIMTRELTLFIDWRLHQFLKRAVVVCSFNTSVALRTIQLTQVRCPSLEYCNARVLLGALPPCYKWASGTHTASSRFSSRDYGQVQSTCLALHLPSSVRSSLPSEQHARMC